MTNGPWATTGLSDKVGADNLEVLPLSQITVVLYFLLYFQKV